MQDPGSERSTLLFCRTRDNGEIEPDWDPSREDVLSGRFEVGTVVSDRYELQCKLGEGAMGRVFLARDGRLDRLVAIKVIFHRRAESIAEGDVLEREAKLGASLNHPGIAAVYDFGIHEGCSYTVFEYVEGETLRSVIRRRGRIPVEESIRIIADLASALDMAHANGLIHRDLKPENIALTSRGEFKILDLGIAHNTQFEINERLYSGTPAYSSPEQAACRPSDGKSDQYALALIAYELIAGRKAFEDTDPRRMLHRQMTEEPMPLRKAVPGVPDHVDEAISQALHKAPEQRFSTCYEFARNLSGEISESRIRHLLPTPVEDRVAFYIGHVAEESLLARQLAESLEANGYLCWHYGRDAIPGIPFAEQAREAIARSQAVVLLLSREALRAGEFRREFEQAQRLGCPLLPILVDMAREEFQELGGDWVRWLAVFPAIEYRRAHPLEPLISRFDASARALGVDAVTGRRRGQQRSEAACTGQPWATDANQIDIHDLPKVLFHNDAIDDFLRRKHRHFVSATKGFGKTLLLTCKRQLLAADVAEGRQSVTMIPEGRPFLDFMSEMRVLSSNYEAPLSQLSTTKRLWNAALRVSAISHQGSLIEECDQQEMKVFPARVRRWLEGAKIQPTVVFKELATLRVSELNRLIDESENFLDEKMRRIHGATTIFIDKVDQAIHHLSRDAWVAIQAGLIEAAWETMNANAHIKIYASIRQEAFANYRSDIKANLFSATTSLNYSEEELQGLLDQLAQCYEGCSSFADFLGLKVVRHGRRPAPEDSFQFLRRHTCGRPRDLVAIASELSSKRRTLNEQAFKEIVRQTSSSVLVSNIFDEVGVFLNCLSDPASRQNFLSLIPANILHRNEAVAVSEQFNGLEPGSLSHFGENSSDIYHPFTDLYLAGMLGVVERDDEEGVARQRFRKPHDPFSTVELPDCEVFLLHPALANMIRSQRMRTGFIQFQHVVVGENLIWEPHFPTVAQIEKQLVDLADYRFSELAHRILKRLQAGLAASQAPFAKVDILASPEWEELQKAATSDSCLEVVLGIEELAGRL